MRLITFSSTDPSDSRAAAGHRSGVVRGQDEVIDCTEFAPAETGGWRGWLAHGDRVALDRYVAAADPVGTLGQLTLQPPVPGSAKILCVGLNYRTHLLETGRPLPEYPTLFPRYADSQMGDRAVALIPAESDRFDYEGELAVVIGRSARRVPQDRAMDVVAGYSVYNDFSVRDWQRHTSQFMAGKNWPMTGAFGPWLITPDEIDDLDACVLTTTVNGEVRQQAPISDLIFDVPALISYISTFTPLAPGDVIVTGTPGGVALFRQEQDFLVSGDEVAVEITGIGTITNPVRAEQA